MGSTAPDVSRAPSCVVLGRSPQIPPPPLLYCLLLWREDGGHNGKGQLLWLLLRAWH